MQSSDLNWITDFIWGVADDVLRLVGSSARVASTRPEIVRTDAGGTA